MKRKTQSSKLKISSKVQAQNGRTDEPLEFEALDLKFFLNFEL